MLFYGTRPAVQVMVNGQGPFLFLVDTGAQGEARADSSLVERLRLPSVGEDRSSDASSRVSASMNVVQLDEIALGDVLFQNVRAPSRNYNTSDYLPHIDGILGFDLFSKYLLTLDYPGKRVILATGSLPKPDQAEVLPLEMRDGNPYTEVSFGTLKLKAMIDSGNIRGIDMPASAVRQLPLASYPRSVGRGGSVSGSFDLREVQLRDPLRIGRHTIPQPTVTFTNAYEEVNLGSSLLRSFVVTFDQAHGRVRLARPRSPVSPATSSTTSRSE